MKLSWRDKVPAGLVDLPASELVQQLDGPTVFDLPGVSDLPPLFVSVLLHGNEVSGWLAVRQLLRRYEDKLPRPLVLLVGDVAAAASGVRRFDADIDLNRIWEKEASHGLGRSFWQLREKMRERNVAAAIDIHNTNGSNPPVALCISRHEDMKTQAIAAGFSGIVINVAHSMHTCTEAFASLCPATAIECGQPGDPDGVALAVGFMEALLRNEKPVPPASTQIYNVAARVSLHHGLRLSFGQGDAEVAMPPDVDKWNLRTVPAGTEIAILGEDVSAPLQALDAAGNDIAADYFDQVGDSLLAARDLCMAMLVADSKMVSLDCLCYLLEPRVSPGT